MVNYNIAECRRCLEQRLLDQYNLCIFCKNELDNKPVEGTEIFEKEVTRKGVTLK